MSYNSAFEGNSIPLNITKKNGIDGIVFGRVDFVGSQGLDLNSINDDNVTESCIKISKKCKKLGLDFVVGGGVSDASIEPGGFADFYVIIDSKANIQYFLRDIKWEYVE